MADRALAHRLGALRERLRTVFARRGRGFGALENLLVLAGTRIEAGRASERLLEQLRDAAVDLSERRPAHPYRDWLWYAKVLIEGARP